MIFAVPAAAIASYVSWGELISASVPAVAVHSFCFQLLFSALPLLKPFVAQLDTLWVVLVRCWLVRLESCVDIQLAIHCQGCFIVFDDFSVAELFFSRRSAHGLEADISQESIVIFEEFPVLGKSSYHSKIVL
jgi:hypothetical protein